MVARQWVSPRGAPEGPTRTGDPLPGFMQRVVSTVRP